MNLHLSIGHLTPKLRPIHLDIAALAKINASFNSSPAHLESRRMIYVVHKLRWNEGYGRHLRPAAAKVPHPHAGDRRPQMYWLLAVSRQETSGLDANLDPLMRNTKTDSVSPHFRSCALRSCTKIFALIWVISSCFGGAGYLILCARICCNSSQLFSGRGDLPGSSDF